MRTQLQRSPSRAGFTLVECLVVIAIVAILIGILIPVVGSARRSAKMTACASNLRQIGQAIFAYQAELKAWPFVRYMPSPFYDEVPIPGGDSWVSRMLSASDLPTSLEKYLDKSSDVFRCPGDDAELVYERCKAQTGHGTSYTSWWVLVGFKPQNADQRNRLLSDFAGYGSPQIVVKDPDFHPKPSRSNLLKVDGSVESERNYADH